MNVANIISVIGNNSTPIPILVKDGMESSAKVYLANKQGDKISKEQGFYEAREAAIEEFGTAGIWFLGPLAIAKAFNVVAKKAMGLKNETLLKTDSQLLSGKHYQTLEKNITKSSDEFIKTDAQKFAAKSGLSKELAAFSKSRYVSGIVLTIAMLGGLTRFKQQITEESIDKNGAPQGITFQRHIRDKIVKHPTFAAFSHKKSEQQGPEPSFKGGVSELAGLAVIDAGIGGIRIGTARDKDERKEYVFKTISFITFNYLSAPLIEKAFNYVATKAKLPIGLDPRVLADKDFTGAVHNATQDEKAKAKMLEFVHVDKNESELSKEEKVIKYIDEQIGKGKYDKNGDFKGFNNHTLEIARKTGLIQIDKKQRAVTKFIDTKHIQAINEHLKEIIDVTSQKGSAADFIKKVKMTKYGAVLANIAICSTIVGVALPKMQYAFRERGIGTVASPGVKASNQHHHPKPTPVA